MANRRPQQQGGGGRRMDFNRNDGRKNFGGRSGVSPWQGGGPGGGMPNLLPLGGGSTEATLALASNIINLLQPRQNPVPSLLDMPIRRDFGPQMGRFDRGFVPNRMGNQGNFRRTGNYNRAGERINNNRKPFKPNDGPKQQSKNSPKKEADSKAKPVKESENADEKKDPRESEQTEGKPEGNDKKEPPKTRYDDINPQLLKCHICNKSMWDGRSFENHLSGRAHAIMMQKTAQSYALTADTMRQEFKIREMKRTRRTGQLPTRDFYCAMCDMYAGDGALHRTTIGHRKLKKYLHPACTACHKEMPTRIELDEHRLTPAHLAHMQDKHDVLAKPKPEVMVISSLSMEQSYLREERPRKRRNDRHDDAPDVKEDDNQEGAVVVKTEDNADEKAAPKVASDTDVTITDFKEGDDLSHVTAEMVPAYSSQRGVGQSFLADFKCVQCTLCNKLLDCQDTAEVHLRTWKHHQLFVKRLQPQAEQTVSSNKRPVTDDEQGHWKRRKVNAEDNDEDQNGENGNIKDEPVAHNVDYNMEDTEDWEQSVDEILNDAQNDEEAENEDAGEQEENPQTEGNQEYEPEEPTDTEPQPEPVAEDTAAPEAPVEPEAPMAPVAPETPKKVEPAKPTGNSPRNTATRGRGRGRARGRGRY